MLEKKKESIVNSANRRNQKAELHKLYDIVISSGKSIEEIEKILNTNKTE